MYIAVCYKRAAAAATAAVAAAAATAGWSAVENWPHSSSPRSAAAAGQLPDAPHPFPTPQPGGGVV